MKKSLLTIIAILAIIPLAGAMHKNTRKKTKATAPNLEFISMHRTACFGRCPDYVIEVYSNGLVKYIGINFVNDSGVYQKNIGTAAVNKLFSEFKQYRVDTCKEVYNNMIPDLPGLAYQLKYASDKTQDIRNAHFGPTFLKELAHSVDEAGKVDKTWKYIGPFKQ